MVMHIVNVVCAILTFLIFLIIFRASRANLSMLLTDQVAELSTKICLKLHNTFMFPIDY